MKKELVLGPVIPRREAVGDPNSKLDELKTARFVTEAITEGLNADYNELPPFPGEWNPSTIDRAKKRWTVITPPGRQALAVLSRIGQGFPECSTLEAMARCVIRKGDFVVDEVKRTLGRFQEKARGQGNPPIVQTSVLLSYLPMMLDLPNLDPTQEALARLIIASTPLIFASFTPSAGKVVVLPEGPVVRVKLDPDGKGGWVTIQTSVTGGSTTVRATQDQVAAAGGGQQPNPDYGYPGHTFGIAGEPGDPNPDREPWHGW